MLNLGPTASGTIEFGIPGAGYDVIEHNSFARVPVGDTYRVEMIGTASGTAEFDIEAASGATITNKAVFQDGIIGTEEVPLSTNAADTGNQFRFDANSNQYIYNLSTDVMPTGAWQLKASTNDGKQYTVLVSIK